MKNADFIFQKNTRKKNKYRFNGKTKRIEIVFSKRHINGDALTELVAIFSSILEKYRMVRPPILLNFSDVEFADKLTYITLECVLLGMIEVHRFDIMLMISGENRVTASGWMDSPMIKLSSSNKAERKEFLDKFRFELNRSHCRRLVRECGDMLAPSRAYDDISDFLRFSGFDFDEGCLDEVTGVIAELISNAIEHGDNECLVDVDIAEGFYHRDDIETHETEYIVLSLVVLDFSPKLIGEGLKRKMVSNIDLPDRYKKISEAFINHETSFDDKYMEEDFYNLAIFQDHISGRLDQSKSGGTGMVKLVRALEERSEGNNCYLLSGKRIITFRKEVMEYDEDGWIGFNSENDFLGAVPDEGITGLCNLFFPGVAYNLQFIMEREKNEDN